MNFIDLVTFIIENIKRQKGRALLTSLGVMIGSASIIVLVSLVGGLQQIATAQFTNNSDLSKIEVNAGFGGIRNMGGGGPEGWGPGGGGAVRTNSSAEEVLLTDNIIEEVAAIEHVDKVVPKQRVSGNSTLLYQKFEGRLTLTGVALDDLSELGLSAAEGEMKLNSGLIILGASVSENMFRQNYSGSGATLTTDLLGKQIQVEVTKTTTSGRTTKLVRFRVAGILAESGDSSDYAAYITMKDADNIVSWINDEKINHTTDGYSSITVRVDDSDNVLPIAEKITEMGFQTQTAQSFLENVNSLFTVMQVVFGGVGAITLLVAAIGIFNTMTMAILERTREIGLLKALGATNQNILSLFIGEAAGIGLLGGIGGVTFGLILGKVINAIAVPYLQAQATSSGTVAGATVVYMPFYLPLFALVFSSIIGCLSGLYPALKAQSMPPVIALKYE